MPPILLSGSTTFKLDDVLIFVVIPVLLIKSSRLKLGFIIKAIGLWIVFMHLSLLIGVFGYYEMDLSQYMVILRYVKLLIFVVYVYQINFRDENLIYFQNTFRIFNILLILFGIAQYFMLDGVVERISSMYANQGHLEAMLHGKYTRVTLTSINPNAAAVLILFCFMNEFSSVITSRRFDFRTGLLVLANIFLLFLTSSRTAFVCLGLTPVILFMAGMMGLRSFVITVMGAAILVNVLPYFEYVEKLLLVFDEGSTSMSARGDVWIMMINAISESGMWFFGFGPAIGYFVHDFDNEYVLLLTRFGVVGILILILILIFGLRKFVKSIGSEYPSVLRKYRFWLLGLTVFSFVIMATNVFYTNFQVSFSYFLLVVAYMNRLDSIEKYSSSHRSITRADDSAKFE
ncbi:MAG: hypothetical protein K9J06_05485 [Flavobacteriales bacterium]|nr:hypothetical protein [Flavobacteriales bacterium]